MAFVRNRAARWYFNPAINNWDQAVEGDDGWKYPGVPEGEAVQLLDDGTPQGQAQIRERLIDMMGYDPDDKRVNQDGTVSVFNPKSGRYEQGVNTLAGNEAPAGLAPDAIQALREPKEGNRIAEFLEGPMFIAGAALGGNAIGNGINMLGAGGFGGSPATGYEWLGGADPMGAPLTMPAGQSNGFFSGIQNALSGIGKTGTGGSTNMAGMWDTIKEFAGPISNIAGALIGSDAAENASEAQISAGRESNALQERMFNQNRADLEPWRAAGGDAVNMLRSGIQPGGSLVKPFGMADYEADPGYNFRLGEGMKAIERSAAARGNLLSGGVLKGITRYGQDMASNEYQNAYNRYNQNQGNAYNRLAGVAGTGQNAVNQVGQMGTSMAQNVGDTLQGIGNARASGYVGQANALSGGLAGAYNSYQSQNLLNRLLAGGGGGMTTVGSGTGFGGAFQDDY